MDPATFNALQPILDEIAEVAEEQLASPELHRLLSELSKLVGEGKSDSIMITVDVCDDKRQQSIPLLTTGLTAFVGKEPFRTGGDSSPQKYVVQEGMQVIPHDRCPVCWGEWDFKFKHLSCPSCGAMLGKDCKVLLDTDQCPWCEEGKVTMANPHCNKCGFEVDPKAVVWG